MPIVSVRFARNCDKMYSRHLFPYGGLCRANIKNLLNPIVFDDVQLSCVCLLCQVHVARCLVKNKVPSSNIVILSPYREQRERISNTLGRVLGCKDILVTTITKSQGKAGYLELSLCSEFRDHLLLCICFFVFLFFFFCFVLFFLFFVLFRFVSFHFVSFCFVSLLICSCVLFFDFYIYDCRN